VAAASGATLTSLPGRDDLLRRVAKPFIPYGATAWRRCEGEWQPLASLPAEWGLRPVGGTLPVVAEEDEEA